MTEFELLAIPLSLILGLGITLILSGVTSAIRQRRYSRLHWLPITWACLIFAFQVHYFFALWDINEDVVRAGTSWTWAVFGPAFFQVVVFFLAAGLILPARRPEAESLLQDFDDHGRLALIPLLLAHLVAIPLNLYQHDATWFHQANIVNVALAFMTTVVLVSGNRNRQGLATILHGLVQLWGIAVAWSKPGV